MQAGKQSLSPAGETWSPLAETASGKGSAATQSKPCGGVLRCGGREPAFAGSQTQARIAEDVAQQTARRIGTMAILTAFTVVGMAILQHALEPEMAAAQQTPLYRLSALFLVLAAAALAVLHRAELVDPERLLDLGLVLEISGALAIALMENSLPWENSAVHGSTVIAAWIAICIVVIPNRPWKSVTAAIISAA